MSVDDNTDSGSDDQGENLSRTEDDHKLDLSSEISDHTYDDFVKNPKDKKKKNRKKINVREYESKRKLRIKQYLDKLKPKERVRIIE